jgi:L-alanine-DL-glutamate epimerase-like enolase superfamily enzyme
MWRATMPYGRKGLAIHAISAVDLALWDCLGKLRDEPIYALIGARPKSDFRSTLRRHVLISPRALVSMAPRFPAAMVLPTESKGSKRMSESWQRRASR